MSAESSISQIEIEVDACWEQYERQPDINEMLATHGLLDTVARVRPQPRRIDSATHRGSGRLDSVLTNGAVEVSPLLRRPLPEKTFFGQPLDEWQTERALRDEDDRVLEAGRKTTYLKAWRTRPSTEETARALGALEADKRRRKDRRNQAYRY